MIGGNVGGRESLARKDEKGSRDHPLGGRPRLSDGRIWTSNLGSGRQSVGVSI